MKYYGKLILVSVLCLLVAVLVILTNGNKRISFASGEVSQVVNEETGESPKPPEGYDQEKPVLLIYDPQEELSVLYKENIEDTLKYMKRSCETIEISRTESISYRNYEMVILASQGIETKLKDGAGRIFDYVEEGGKFFWGILQNEVENEFFSSYKKMGVIDYGDYLSFQKMEFNEELLPGMKGEVFDSPEFEDVCLFVRLDEEAKVYISADINDQAIPLFWTYDYGEGRIGCYNGTAITGDFYKGIVSGCINALYDDVMYPVINAKCIYIDDFPSPQYESTSDIVRKDYNRSVKEFYRDIWWPDMQKAANKYDYRYTGLFIATYNDIVDPDDFVFEAPSMEQYYGNSLLRAGHEMGLHGYNHQSLAKAGEVPDDMGYKAWGSADDMAASIEELLSIAENMFPGISFSTYVPPSNYLSEAGREAVVRTMPDLTNISGVYTSEGEEGAVYEQRFEIAEDGIAEFPRVTSGMLLSDFERLEWMSALGLHGVFSHFIHPDDIFDMERGKGENWETLLEGFEDTLNHVNEAAPGLRALTASDGAKALEVYQELEPVLVYDEGEIRGSLKNFRGEAFFFLCTDKTPVSKDDACLITSLGTEGDGPYYMVTAKKAEFTILLKGD